MSKLPVQKPIDWRHASLSIGVLLLLCAVGYWIDGSTGVLVATIAYLLLSVLLRAIFAMHHRRGIVCCRNGNFATAVEEFQRSHDFFNRHRWIDRFRGLTMLSSGHSYIEMALVSLGFSHIQLNQRERAREYYQTCLQQFPQSQMAIAGLHFLDSTDTPAIEKEIHG